MPKRAVELSLNTVIIGAICLIVLIVLVVVFTGQTGKFTRGMNDCASKGAMSSNDCASTAAECIQNGGIPSGDCVAYNSDGTKKWDNPSQVCCPRKTQ